MHRPLKGAPHPASPARLAKGRSGTHYPHRSPDARQVKSARHNRPVYGEARNHPRSLGACDDKRKGTAAQ